MTALAQPETEQDSDTGISSWPSGCDAGGLSLTVTELSVLCINIRFEVKNSGVSRVTRTSKFDSDPSSAASTLK